MRFHVVVESWGVKCFGRILLTRKLKWSHRKVYERRVSVCFVCSNAVAFYSSPFHLKWVDEAGRVGKKSVIINELLWLLLQLLLKVLIIGNLISLQKHYFQTEFNTILPQNLASVPSCFWINFLFSCISCTVFQKSQILSWL